MKKLSLAVVVAMMLVVVLSFTANAAINDGILDYYSFDSDASDALDGNNVPLQREDQIVGDAACGTGCLEIGQRRDVCMLAAADAYGPFFDDNEMTIAVWVKLDPAYDTNHTIVGFGTGANYDYFRFFIQPGKDILSVYFQSTDVTYVGGNADGNVLRDGQWHHVALTSIAGDVPVFYIDGEMFSEAEDKTVSKFIGDSTGYFVIGAMNGYEDSFRGCMDDLRIYGRALSEDEIGELVAMKGTTPEKPEAPVITIPDDTWDDDWDDWDDDDGTTEPSSGTQPKATEKAPETDDGTTSDGSKTGLYIGIAAAAVVIIAVVVAIILSKKKKK